MRDKRIILTKACLHSLADIIKALNKLSPSDEEAVNAILETLGIHLEPEITKVKSSKCCEKIQEHSLEENETSIVDDIPLSYISSEIFVEPEEPSLSSKLIPLEKSYTTYPKWFNYPLNLKNTLNPRDPITSYPLQTLFIPNWTRAILVSSLSIYDDIGSINIDEIVRLISQNKPLRRIPRLPRPTMVHGVQVLIDESKALEPFYKDQTHLIQIIQKTAGSDRTQIMRFVGCPSRGVIDEISSDWSYYLPPSSKSTVLLITDLGILKERGITDRAGVHEWFLFASAVRKAGCSLVAFVPYPEERWPKLLQDSMKIIQWDRTTSTSTIQQIVRKSF